MGAGGRLKEVIKKYGKVAVGVHVTVSGASVAGLYVAIKNKVDVESILERFHLPGISRKPSDPEQQESNRRAGELAASASTGGALALAILCNKALFPIRLPITIALTPPLSRFLARRNIIKN